MSEHTSTVSGLVLAFLAWTYAIYCIGRASMRKVIADDYVRKSGVRGAMREILRDFRDTVHQYGNSRERISEERFTTANSIAGIVHRLDGSELLQGRWKLDFSENEALVDELIRDISTSLASCGTDSEQHTWQRVLETRAPMRLSQLLAQLMNPEHPTTRLARKQLADLEHRSPLDKLKS
jgi:hypothetical protein